MFALGLFLISAQFVSAAIHAHGHEIICLILQISAGAVLLAAAGLGVFLLSAPILQVDHLGISERNHMIKGLDWDMTWNEIAYAELVGEIRGRLRIIGLESNEVEHILAGYDRFEALVQQIRSGLWKYGRRVVESGRRFSSNPKSF
ncbi:MAG: hypothetical protein WEA61_04435 [Anaerolineales bacterium]